MKHIDKLIRSALLLASISLLGGCGSRQEPPLEQPQERSPDKVQLWEGGPYWAVKNIGAEEPWDSGLYFWWGDTVGYRRGGNAWVANDGSSSDFSFKEDDIPTYGKAINQLRSEGWVVSKDGSYVLAPEHDAAKVLWGGSWRMPTEQECNDLNEKCYWEWTTTNGVAGYIVSGKGDYGSASIFLPAVGYVYRTSLDNAGLNGCYLSSVPKEGIFDFFCLGLSFNSSYHRTNYDLRSNGRCVRPVQGFADDNHTVDKSKTGGCASERGLSASGTNRSQNMEPGVGLEEIFGVSFGKEMLESEPYETNNSGYLVYEHEPNQVFRSFSKYYLFAAPISRCVFQVRAISMMFGCNENMVEEEIDKTTRQLEIQFDRKSVKDGNSRVVSFENGDKIVIGKIDTPLCPVVKIDAMNKTWAERAFLDKTLTSRVSSSRKSADDGEKAEYGKNVRRNLEHGKVQLWEDGPYWAATNIGAEKPEDHGLYFWWGDTVGYRREGNSWIASDGSSSNFSFAPDNAPTDNKDIATLQREGWIVSKAGSYVLVPQHDAAHVHWGGAWRMPTDQEFKDLKDKCDWMWTTLNGVNGYIVSGKDDYASASIFLPAAGGGGSLLFDAGSGGHYWSSVPLESGSDYAWSLYFFSGRHYTGSYSRSNGRCVRPVQGFAE